MGPTTSCNLRCGSSRTTMVTTVPSLARFSPSRCGTSVNITQRLTDTSPRIVSAEGESARHRREHGGGSGAPCQDHYNCELDPNVLEAEFPLGKRIFSHKL